MMKVATSKMHLYMRNLDGKWVATHVEKGDILLKCGEATLPTPHKGPDAFDELVLLLAGGSVGWVNEVYYKSFMEEL
jgi:hypothetical protein